MSETQVATTQAETPHRFLAAPATKLGWTATGIAIVAIALMLVSAMPSAIVGVVAGILAAVALARGERSMLVWFGLAAGLFFVASIASAFFMK